MQPIAITFIYGALVRRLHQGSLLAIASAVLFGLTLAIANERRFGTLRAWLFAPQRILTRTLAKAVPHCMAESRAAR
jgi:hypothetical protein